jgi:hypothetical protein
MLKNNSTVKQLGLTFLATGLVIVCSNLKDVILIILSRDAIYIDYLLRINLVIVAVVAFFVSWKYGLKPLFGILLGCLYLWFGMTGFLSLFLKSPSIQIAIKLLVIFFTAPTLASVAGFIGALIGSRFYKGKSVSR